MILICTVYYSACILVYSILYSILKCMYTCIQYCTVYYCIVHEYLYTDLYSILQCMYTCIQYCTVNYSACILVYSTVQCTVYYSACILVYSTVQYTIVYVYFYSVYCTVCIEQVHKLIRGSSGPIQKSTRRFGGLVVRVLASRSPAPDSILGPRPPHSVV